ncbi:UNVERIFIED_CONTAM: GDSL esterase/lipase CPRD49 [Sesamum radiatum]|uniref:GDSL esterase/lipase CPRD49 n=1 Tax=Sesamum radiatum TaxID=300843 RepID=A0AAW2KAQ2_SESRA
MPIPGNAEDAAIQPSLVIVYFGGNDSMGAHSSGLGPHVPLPEYTENMRKIAFHLKHNSLGVSLAFFLNDIRVHHKQTALISCPPVNQAKLCENMSSYFSVLVRTNELCRIYSEACIELCREMDLKVIDLWTAIQKREDWSNACFTDGVHLSAEESKVLKVLKQAEWQPSLHWKSLPT